MSTGPQQAAGVAIANPLPLSWLGRADMPLSLPQWASIAQLSTTNTRNLLAQIGYDKSNWNYQLVGTANQLGRYQFSTQILENYGLLAAGSNAAYGTNCVNYLTCWTPVTIRNTNSLGSYNYNITSLSGFLNNVTAQDHLAYQILFDLYNALGLNNAILPTDTADVVAGMIYVGWTLGAGATPTSTNGTGTGAYAWRYSGLGTATNAYNSGRYSVTVLSQ